MSAHCNLDNDFLLGFPGQDKREKFSERVLSSFNTRDLRWFLIIHNKEHLARVDAALPFPLFLKQLWKPPSLLCRQQPAGDAPSLGLESGLGVNLHDASTPANPGMSELLGQPLIPICQRLTSCPERTVKTAFSNQPSGELGSYNHWG